MRKTKKIYSFKKKNIMKKKEEYIKEKRKEKYICSCGSECLKSVMNQHERSKKHLKYLESTTIET